MGFAKGISGKGFYLSVNLCTQLFRMTSLPTGMKKLLLYSMQFLNGATLTTDGSSENITIRCFKSGIMQGDFDYIFLINHHTIGLT